MGGFVTDTYETLINEMDTLVYRMLNTMYEYDKAASISASEIEKMEQLTKENLQEYHDKTTLQVLFHCN